MRWTVTIAALVMSLLFCVSAWGRVLSPGQYATELANLKTNMEKGRVEDSRRQARDLLDDEVQWDTGLRLATDRSILRDVTLAARPADLFASQRNLSELLSALARGEHSSAPKVDHSLLSRLQSERYATSLARGGRVPTVPAMNETVLQYLTRMIKKVREAVRRWITRLFDWLSDLFLSEKDREAGFLGTPTVVALMVGAIALLLVAMALWVLRSSRGKEKIILSASSPEESASDADPLSRASNEWEQYARELARAGRVREAIRAWYHAVLVASYRSGVIQYRKGRTNWEYVAALPPALSWRSRFVSMTRIFEREWYGRDRSELDALELCASDASSILQQLAGARTR